MTLAVADRLQAILGAPVAKWTGLSGGCVGEVRAVTCDDGRVAVVKLGPGLETEAYMLEWLAAHSALPLPKVLHGSDELIVMDFVATGGSFAAHDAADHLAKLHAISADRFGFARDTMIGGLPQPNPQTERWVDFFGRHRLLFMAAEAEAAGQLPRPLRHRIDDLVDRLHRWLDEPAAPSLVHGDAWGGNILCRDGKVAAFIDPAIHFADAEVELAFGTLFGTFDQRFFARYQEHRPLRPGFWEARRDLLNLYPLLVHVRLFGGSYVAQVERIVRRFV
jgi:fructosamine-3-kinase